MLNHSAMHEQRTQINATDMEGASSIIAGLDNDVSQIQEQPEKKFDKS